MEDILCRTRPVKLKCNFWGTHVRPFHSNFSRTEECKREKVT